jgi:hypothetical protein
MSVQETRHWPVTYKDYGGIHFLRRPLESEAGNPSTAKHPKPNAVSDEASKSTIINNKQDRVSPGRATGRATVPTTTNAISAMQDLTRCMIREAASETSRNAEEEASSTVLYTH